MVGGERRLELGVIEREQGRSGRQRVRSARRTPLVLVASGLLELREALEAERLREPDHRARGCACTARQLFRGLKRRLVKVIDDVLRDVLLGAGEVVEAGPDVGGQSL